MIVASIGEKDRFQRAGARMLAGGNWNNGSKAGVEYLNSN